MTSKSGNIIGSTPPPTGDEELKKGFATAIVDQPKLLDELGKQLVTLNLAIPGLFATVMKLTSGEDAVIHLDSFFTWAFICWLIALILSLVSLTPRTWKVDRAIVRRQKAAIKDQPLSIEEFFMKSARHKRRLLIVASLCCFLGICLAGFSIFSNPITERHNDRTKSPKAHSMLEVP